MHYKEFTQFKLELTGYNLIFSFFTFTFFKFLLVTEVN